MRIARARKLGPARPGPLIGLPASTVHAILSRHGLSRHGLSRHGLSRHGLSHLAIIDRPTRQPIRRYERHRPASWCMSMSRRSAGCATAADASWAATASHHRARCGPRVGFDYLHAGIDDHTRLAYAEIHPDERAATCARFLHRAAAAFAELGVDRIEQGMTDNALAYRRSAAWRDTLAGLCATARFTRRYRPQPGAAQ